MSLVPDATEDAIMGATELSRLIYTCRSDAKQGRAGCGKGA